MSAEVSTGKTFESSPPKKVLSFRPFVGAPFVTRYDLAADGQLLVDVPEGGEENSPPITLLLNGTADLKR
jgi:hypothetical protein